MFKFAFYDISTVNFYQIKMSDNSLISFIKKKRIQNIGGSNLELPN